MNHSPAASLRSAASVDSSGARVDARFGIASHELAAEARESDEPGSDGETFAPPARAVSGEDAGTTLRGEAGSSADQAADPVSRFARAIGSAVHRALEILNIDAIEDGGAERARLEAVIDATLAGLMPAHSAHVRARALDLLDRALAPGGVVAQLRERASEIVARELPVLLQRESPRGVVVGTIDLLYRDRGSGRLVVADWKTDRVTADAAITRAAEYRAQGEVYVDAARRALGDSVAPRFELWFVDAAAIVALDLDR
jgi:ATP-dependent exoDNAse (exonuclease V) beta subunit